MKSAGGLAALFLVCAGGCSALFDLDDLACTGADCGEGGGASSSDASSSTATGATASTGAGGDGTGGGTTDETVVFVAPDGDDEAAGTREAPLRTLGEGLARAAEAPAPRAVHACLGSWEEGPLRIEADVSLRGGFDCASWVRPDDFDASEGAELSRLGVAFDAGSDVVATLVVSGDAIEENVEVSGFHVVASADPAAARTGGVEVESGAAPALRDLRIDGGSGATEGSFGIEVRDGGAPVIERCTIDGGDGNANQGVGAVGVHVRDDAGETTVAENVIVLRGGSLSFGNNGASFFEVASAGVILEGVDAQGSRALRDNVIEVAPGAVPLVTPMGGQFVAAGILSLGGTVDVTGNAVTMGVAAATKWPMGGILVLAGDGAQVTANRVYAGSGADITLGMVVGGDDAVAENNLVHGGFAELASEALGIGGARVRAIGNTLHAVSVDGRAHPLVLSGELAEVEGNLLMGRGNAVAIDLIAEGACEEPAQPFASLRGNAMLGIDLMLGLWDGGACVETLVGDSASTLEQHVESQGGVASDNLRVRGDCGGSDSPPCVQSGAGTDSCAQGSDCPHLLLAAFDDGVGGVPTLEGWSLGPQAPCAVAQSAFDPGLSVDATGAERQPPPSLGALESDGACEPD